jgi:hypothetical protein
MVGTKIESICYLKEKIKRLDERKRDGEGADSIVAVQGRIQTLWLGTTPLGFVGDGDSFDQEPI